MMDSLYTIAGAFIGTWIVYNIFHIVLWNFFYGKTVIITSFIGSSILILVVSSFTMDIVTGFVRYMPPLFLWLIMELVKLNKKGQKNESTDNKRTAI